MSYKHIDNLFKNQEILMFKQCFATEKLHGSSMHVSWDNGHIKIFSGGLNHETFSKIFDIEVLEQSFQKLGYDKITVYGEGYGGKTQGMRATYGDQIRFAAFEVKVGDCWLSVPDAEEVAIGLGFDFVHYVLISTDLKEINKQRDAESVQAIRNGMGPGHKREGIVLRPLIEVRKNNGQRIVAKHKNEDFCETKTKRPINAEKLQVLTEAKAIADEWVTINRLSHVLDQVAVELNVSTEKLGMEQMGIINKTMQKDIEREGEGEAVFTHDVRKAIGKRTALLMKQRLQSTLS